MLLSKVNRRASGAVTRKKFPPQNELKKISNKQPATPQIKFRVPANNQNKANVTNRVKPTEFELLPPSDSEDEWANCGRLGAYWRPLHRLNATQNATKEPTESHSVKAQAKVEFDNISKRINKVYPQYLWYIKRLV